MEVVGTTPVVADTAASTSENNAPTWTVDDASEHFRIAAEARVPYFPNDLQRRMQEQVKATIGSGKIRPKRGMEILDRYRACFEEDTVNGRITKDNP